MFRAGYFVYVTSMQSAAKALATSESHPPRAVIGQSATLEHSNRLSTAQVDHASSDRASLSCATQEGNKEVSGGF